MRTQTTIIREYANGMADAFLNDLVLATERQQAPVIVSENALIEAFKKYVAGQIQNGWLSQNDVRVLEDLNPIFGNGAVFDGAEGPATA
jgi:hypothetical protein